MDLVTFLKTHTKIKNDFIKIGIVIEELNVNNININLINMIKKIV